MMCKNPKLDPININQYTKFGEIISICSQDIEWNEIMMDGRNDRWME